MTLNSSLLFLLYPGPLYFIFAALLQLSAQLFRKAKESRPGNELMLKPGSPWRWTRFAISVPIFHLEKNTFRKKGCLSVRFFFFFKSRLVSWYDSDFLEWRQKNKLILQLPDKDVIRCFFLTFPNLERLFWGWLLIGSAPCWAAIPRMSAVFRHWSDAAPARTPASCLAPAIAPPNAGPRTRHPRTAAGRTTGRLWDTPNMSVPWLRKSRAKNARPWVFFFSYTTRFNILNLRYFI